MNKRSRRKKKINIVNPQEQERAIITYDEDEQQIIINYIDRYYLVSIDGINFPNTIVKENNYILSVGEMQNMENPPIIYLDTPDQNNITELYEFLNGNEQTKGLISLLKNISFQLRCKNYLESLYMPYLNLEYAHSFEDALIKLTSN